MKIVKTIVIGGLILFALYFFIDRQGLDEKLDRSQAKVTSYEDSLTQAQVRADSLESIRDSLNEKTNKLQTKIASLDRQLTQTNQAYEDSIASIEKAKLTELIDSTYIIQKGDTTFVLVTESFYRQSLSNRVELKRLRSIVGIYRNKTQLQDSIIEMKDESIANLMYQVATYKHQVDLKDSIITEKDLQIDVHERRTNKFKTQRNLILGGSLSVILLIVL